MWITRSRSASSTYGRRSCGVNERHFFPINKNNETKMNQKNFGVEMEKNNNILLILIFFFFHFELKTDESIMWTQNIFQGKLVLHAYLN